MNQSRSSGALMIHCQRAAALRSVAIACAVAIERLPRAFSVDASNYSIGCGARSGICPRRKVERCTTKTQRTQSFFWVFLCALCALVVNTQLADGDLAFTDVASPDLVNLAVT